MINAESKDQVLKFLVSNGYEFDVDFEDLQSELGTNPKEVELIIDQFEDFGLLKQDKYFVGTYIRLKADAVDFLNHGGFYAQEELLKKNIEKLLLELDNLKPNLPDRIEKITSIISGITSALGLFIRS